MSTLPDFPDELVTRAPVRYLDLPGGGRAALVTLDNGFDHTKPTTFGPQGLLNIEAAIDAALGQGDLAFIAVTGKPFIFAVGADLKVMESGATIEQAAAIFALGHRVFGKLRSSPVPTFASSSSTASVASPRATAARASSVTLSPPLPSLPAAATNPSS